MCRLCTSISILVLWGTAQAGGFFVPIRGAQSMARGGANLVSPDLLDAMWMNPAGLAGSTGLQLTADLYMGQQYSSFQRADDPILGSFDEAVNQGTPFISLDSPLSIPLTDSGTNLMLSGFGASYDFGVPGLALGVGIQGPMRGNESYDIEGAQRYSIIESTPVTIHYQLAAAYRLHPKLDLGLVVQNVYVDISQSLAMSADPFGGEDPLLDARVSLSAAKLFNPSFILGAIGRPLSWLEVAASFSQGFALEADGTLAAEFGEGLMLLSGGDIAISNPDISMALRLPSIARLGARVVQPRFDVEASVVWEDWSVYDKVEVDTRDVVLTSASLEGAGFIDGPQSFGTIVLNTRWRDVWRVSVGGEYIVLDPELRVRVGTFWERGAIPSSNLDASRMDLTKFGVAAGLRYEFTHVFLEGALGYVASPATTVTDSEVRLIHALDPEHYNGVIGNGVYSVSYLTAALAVGVRIPGL